MSDFGDLEKPILAKSVRFKPGQRAKYVPNHPSFGAFMRSDQMRDVTVDVAKDIAALARANVREHQRDISDHRSDDRPSSGLHERVRAGFKVKRAAGLMKVAGNLRVRVDVVNDAEGSALLEFGARGLPRQRMLGRAGAAFGDFKPEGGPS